MHADVPASHSRPPTHRVTSNESAPVHFQQTARVVSRSPRQRERTRAVVPTVRPSRNYSAREVSRRPDSNRDRGADRDAGAVRELLQGGAALLPQGAQPGSDGGKQDAFYLRAVSRAVALALSPSNGTTVGLRAPGVAQPPQVLGARVDRISGRLASRIPAGGSGPGQG
jgi:hypothetical protein